jgi:hypothetical protein
MHAGAESSVTALMLCFAAAAAGAGTRLVSRVPSVARKPPASRCR